MAATLATAGSHGVLKAKSLSPEVSKRFDATATRQGFCRAAVAGSSSESVRSLTKKKKKLPDAAWPVLFYRDWVEKYGSSKFHGEEEDDGDSSSQQNHSGSSSADAPSKTTDGKI